MNKFVVYNFPADFDMVNKNNCPVGSFYLGTCQRTLIADVLDGKESLEFYLRHLPYALNQKDAYQFLLEVVCGIKSKLVGESEIVGQFKEGFEKYLESSARKSTITQIIQKLFKDGKSVRSKFLADIGQYSYAGVTKKLIKNRGNENKILIVGSGQLAEDLLKVLHRKYDLHLMARNTEKVSALKNLYDFKITSWENFNETINFGSIVNTIGTNEILFNQDYFKNFLLLNGQKSLFIDLGSPSSISTPYDVANGVIRLDDIFQMSQSLNTKKMDKINNAKKEIILAAQRRWNIFVDQSLFPADELNEQTIQQ